MSNRAHKPRALPVAVRAFLKRAGRTRTAAPRPTPRGWAPYALILDTETTTDPSQHLLFGSYQFCQDVNGAYVCMEEGLIYADELPKEDPAGYRLLRAHAARAAARVTSGGARTLRCYSRTEFIERAFYPAACRADALIVGFNLPFDLSRLAVECGEGRGWYYGGFSLVMANYATGKRGPRAEDTYFARVCVKSLDSKRAFVGFKGGRERHKGQGMRGRFLDLRALAFALTSVGHSLDSACRAFGVKLGKGKARAHGRITEAYIRYNRRDVTASLGLLNALRAEYDRHPIRLDPEKAYSPATIAKAHLDAMGIAEPRRQFADVPPKYLGHAMSAYYGGRSEVRVRNTAVPVVYLDFLSMYPTVNALTRLWRILTAERLTIEDCTARARRTLQHVTPERVLDPKFWGGLVWYAKVRPSGDILPARARYSAETDAWNIGINRVTSDAPLWYAAPDLVASALLTSKAPEIVEAFAIVPHGRQKSLRPIDLRGCVRIDPKRDDFFRRVIEERKSLGGHPELSAADRARLGLFLKILANAGGYGIYGEVNVADRPKKAKHVPMRLFGTHRPIDFSTRAPEDPGAYNFPIVAALIPAAARLMLALLERLVTDAGGCYALCDTDSMAIVASEQGGRVPCPNGAERGPDGRPAIQALSWAQVESIREKFCALSPYDRTIVPGSILKIEDENFAGRVQQPLFVYAISAKRYALFWRSPRGAIRLVKKSDHGLGHLLNPADPDRETTEWIDDTWLFLIRKALGIPHPEPAWIDRPAVARISISSPAICRPLLEGPAPYRARVKPFNFALSVQVTPLGYPAGADPTHFHLMAPFERDARKWLRMKWTDVYSGRAYRITTGARGAPGLVRVKSMRDVLDAYATHPEPKSAGAQGAPCDRTTKGLLERRVVTVGRVVYIGKEARLVEEVEAGLVHEWEAVAPVYAVEIH